MSDAGRLYEWLAGTAAARGTWWAEEVVRTLVRQGRPLTPWPDYEASARVRAIARRRSVDDQDDEALIERLARACAAAAQQRYAELVADEKERQRVLVQWRRR